MSNGRPLRSIAGIGATLAAAAMILAGCASDSGDGSNDAGSSAPAAAEVSEQMVAASEAEQAQASEPGPYAVGHRTITVTDASRAGRTFPADIWYPVDSEATAGATPAEYAFLPGLGYTSDGAFTDAVAADGEFPLLVYSHGGGGFRWVATFYTEFMASKGFVVISPDHPGSTALDLISGAGVDETVNANNRPADITATIDAALAADADAADLLAGRIDDELIALSGHSWGGYTSLATVAGHTNTVGTTTPDTRIKAIALQAPYTEMLSDDELANVDVPTLIISSTGDTSTPIESNTDRPVSLIEGRPLLRLDIQGGSHNSFTDVCKLRDAVADNPNIPEAIGAELARGSAEACDPEVLPAEVVQDVTNSYTAAFLARELEASSAYDEMLNCVAPPSDVECTVEP
jgi:predicted dienelactone hydrolase